MDLLPLESLLEEDTPLAGSELTNLAKLHRLGLPVADGVVVFPPEFKFQTILEYYQINDREIFEQKLEFVKKEILKIPIPDDLEKILRKKKINPQTLWHHLLDFWLNQIRSKLWREGLGQGLNKGLTAQSVFFTKKIKASGKAYFDFDRKITVIERQSGVLSEKEVEKINQIVKKANKILVFPHIYDWVKEHDLEFVKVTPFTQYPAKKADENITHSAKNVDTALKNTPKSALKIFLRMDKNFRISNEVDGCFICGENFSDFDHKLLQIVEAASSYPSSPTFFKLSDLEDQDEVRGALRLIHQESLLKQDVEALVFARDKKNFYNMQLVIPRVRSVTEYKTLKNKIEKLGLKQSGNLKFWLELCTPENLLNIDEYLKEGVDGVVLNLDELASLLGGFSQTDQEKVFYSSQVEGIIKLLKDSIKLLHQAKKPIIAFGSLALNDELLHFLLKNGLWGLVVDYPHSLGIQDYLRQLERKIVKRSSV